MWCSKHCLGEDLKGELNVYSLCVSCAVCCCARLLLTLVTVVTLVWVDCFSRSIFSCSQAVIPSIMWLDYPIKDGRFSSLHCHQPFLYTNINLHRKWNCNFAKSRSHRRALGVICLEVSVEIKNICPLTLFLLQSNISCCHYSLSMMCWRNV